MISFLEAQQIIQQHTALTDVEHVDVNSSLGRICATDITSRETLPAFDNSAMDGFAVRASDARVGLSLKIIGSTFAGQPPATPNHTEGCAWRIMTGAPMPSGFDAVIPIEQVTVNAEQITLNESVNLGQHIRRRGEDFDLKGAVLPAGQTINALSVMALAATGIATVPVYRTPTAVVFATGDELVDDATQPLLPGQIRNSNAPFLRAALAQAGVQTRYGGLQADNATAFKTQLANTLKTKPDLVLSSGAVSAGDADFIPAVIRELGGTILFHKVAIKPGKPILFARFDNGSFYFGLPGNPISTAIGFRFFVRPFLMARMGLKSSVVNRATLTTKLHKKTSLREFRKAQLTIDNGRLWVTEMSGQESHRIAPLQRSNAWLIVEENTQNLSAGDQVDITGLFDDTLSF